MFGRIEGLYTVGAQLNMGVREPSVPKVRLANTTLDNCVIVLTDSQILISRLVRRVK